MIKSWVVALGVAVGSSVAALPAQAQGPGQGQMQMRDARPIVAEATVGWAGFVDDATIDHTVIGGGLRVPLFERVSVGPEVFYAIGPGHDRDWFVLGSIWFDLVRERRGTPVVPYLVAGAGLMHNTNRYGPRTFTYLEGAFSAGGGARARVTDRVFVGGDVRLGWELHLRAAAHVGIALR
jgi:hypothetical protein